MTPRSVAAYGRSAAGRRWMTLVESFTEPGRYTRGLGYARNGHVSLPSIEAGMIRTFVSGSQPAPFEVAVAVRALDEFQLDEVISRMRDEPGILTRVVGGAVPDDLIDATLPESSDFRFWCSCPDVAVPCKHAVATLCDVAMAIDQNPAVLLILRGADPDLLLRGVEADAGAAGPVDHFGADLVLPPLPDRSDDGTSALDVLDIGLLRRALRGVDPDEAAVGWAVEDLRTMYRRLVE